MFLKSSWNFKKKCRLRLYFLECPTKLWLRTVFEFLMKAWFKNLRNRRLTDSDGIMVLSQNTVYQLRIWQAWLMTHLFVFSQLTLKTDYSKVFIDFSVPYLDEITRQNQTPWQQCLQKCMPLSGESTWKKYCLTCKPDARERRHLSFWIQEDWYDVI